jgi:methoxymalonate biosynthesis acyl carrier protein
MSDRRTMIREFVCGHLNISGCADEDDLFASGYANSLHAVQLVMFVEGTFGIAVTDQDLDIRNFSSIASVDKFVTEKLTEAG